LTLFLQFWRQTLNCDRWLDSLIH